MLYLYVLHTSQSVSERRKFFSFRERKARMRGEKEEIGSFLGLHFSLFFLFLFLLLEEGEG